ncbi:MAG: hypothetical protein EOR22_32785, partial [Mesorhizobium sp.]
MDCRTKKPRRVVAWWPNEHSWFPQEPDPFGSACQPDPPQRHAVFEARTGVDVTVALSIVAAAGASPEKLVSYFGLNPRVQQSGHITLGAARRSWIGSSESWN